MCVEDPFMQIWSYWQIQEERSEVAGMLKSQCKVAGELVLKVPFSFLSSQKWNSISRSDTELYIATVSGNGNPFNIVIFITDTVRFTVV